MSISVVQTAVSQGNSATFGSPVTAGNSVVVITYGWGPTGIVFATGTVTLGGSSVASSQMIQGYQSNNQGTDWGGYSMWLLPDCPGGSTALSWTFTLDANADNVLPAGTIAYEIAGLGSNPLVTMGTSASNTGSTAIDSGGTGQLQFSSELVLAASIVHGSSAAGATGFTSLNNGTDNCWAGYQINSATGTSYDWAQTGSVSDYWAAGIISIMPNSSSTGTFRLFNGVNGPASANNYSGSFLAGVNFNVTTGNCWFEGYWWWVCGSGQNTAATKCALWQHTGQDSSTPTLIPGSVVTSGTLSAGQWNYIALPTPVQLSIGTIYTAAVAVNGSFPDTNNTWGAAQIYPSGITVGSLNAFGTSGSNTSNNGYYAFAQGVFTTAGSDPSTTCPEGGSNTDNFWVDMQITTQQPAGYTGTYRLWPNNGGSQEETSGDSAVDYVVGTEIDLSEPCILNKIWYFSPTGTAQLATAATVWSVASQLPIANNTSPTWSGAAASGWVSCSFSNVTLQPGKYRVTVYNGSATPDGWSPKQLYYWIWGAPGANGIAMGPLFAPDTSHAQVANKYQASGSEPGQSVFAVGPPNLYPNTYVDDLFQNYWVDMEVSIASGSGLLMTSFL